MITTLYASLLAILYLCLTVYVIQGRWKYHIGLGDGGNPAMLQRIRMHANCAEFVPFGLLLLFLVDYSHFSAVIVHILGIMLLVGRILHAQGIHQNPVLSFGRSAGVVLTLSMILACAVLLLWRYIVVGVTPL